MSSLLENMILGIGIDLVKVDRIEKAMSRWAGAFTGRVFTEHEVLYCLKQKRPAEVFAARFAAKEAVMKAFGTGLSGGVSWKDVEVVRSDSGKPDIVLDGRLKTLASEMGVSKVFISFSHDSGFAVAQAVLTGDK